ncbi:MAG: molybdopterin-dependent oxidoreductase [Gammaproteobacteria bacterium]|nr:molybdopterin-dependent oxidoreductase [Gammaproteobacteria bacterium]
MANRRDFIKGIVGGSMVMAANGLLVPRFAWAGESLLDPVDLPSGTLESAVLEALNGKKPLLKRAYRPPNYETPLNYFNDVITPNDAFFVRWHLANIPEIKAADWKLRVGGDANGKKLELTIASLKKDFEQVEVTAVCQCSGNRRGLSNPHVPGVQWGYGAMGNARWKGVRVKDILNKAGVKKEAVELAFRGGDTGVLEGTPDFVKSIPMWKALDENTLLAYEMNGEPIPHWNGAPVRLVVPGWTATYWMKQIVSLDAISQPLKGFWMEKAYRIPKGKFPAGVGGKFDTQDQPDKVPITEMVVNSIITSLKTGDTVKVGQETTVKGIAWDSGYGIKAVEVSMDGGKHWREAKLGKDHGKFSFRPWEYSFKPEAKGEAVVMAKATNSTGETQVFELIFNPAGYHNNVVHKVALQVV